MIVFFLTCWQFSVQNVWTKIANIAIDYFLLIHVAFQTSNVFRYNSVLQQETMYQLNNDCNSWLQ